MLSTKKRGRDGDAAREAILAAAEEIFAQKGYSGARVEDIAEISGYSNSLIVHHYFTGKQGLYEAVIHRMKQRGMAQMLEILKPAYHADDSQLTAEMVQAFLSKAIRMRFDQLLAHENNRRILAWEAAERWSIYARMSFTQEELCGPQEAIQFVRRAQKAGIIRPEIDPTILVTHVMGSPLIYLLSLPSYQLLMPHTDFTSPEALIHAREQLVEMIVRGVVSPTPPTTTPQAIDNDAEHQDRAVSTQEKEALNSL
ncbi:MAG TPA: TetR family transcriptional regulator [Ktedonobacterales bacterium]|nr:TetR family transcriptional regulator [Ktedonobacterales bacterium]